MMNERVLEAQILIADDVEEEVRLLQDILALAGYRHCSSTTDAREVVDLAASLHPDLIVLDFHMPHLDGASVLEQLRSFYSAGNYLPVLVLTGDASFEAKERALKAGARDFLSKPVLPAELLLRMQNLLETRFLYVDQHNQNEILEKRVVERTAELETARIDLVERLARIAEFRDDETHEHTLRVGWLTAALARELGLPETEIQILQRAAPLHDIGKIGTPDAILLKPGRLTPGEFELMKQHTIDGAAILANGQSDLIRMAEKLAQSHHERWDGSGYPFGLHGETIPFSARIVAVADVYDALTHRRPYKPAWPVEAAVAEIIGQSGRHFDPSVVDALLALQPWVESIPTP